MEITINTPVQEWYVLDCREVGTRSVASHFLRLCPIRVRSRYVATKDNNLSYWGLDYPPLTAYQVGCRNLTV
jgi:ALG6, ALG8 glycosyltransferase family